MASLGAGAAVVGLITGAAEAVSYVLRLVTGPAADRRSRRWKLAGGGYILNVVVVPLLALATSMWSATVIVLAERVGKAVKAPARDSMLADAGTAVGHGRAFGLHEAMDQTGALIGPLVVALMLAVGAGYQGSFAVLAVPAVGVVIALAVLRARSPDTSDYARASAKPTGDDADAPAAQAPPGLPTRFRWYLGFSALTMSGYATFGVLSYHLAIHHVVSTAVIPLVYAAAMATAAVVAIAGGNAYTRSGLRALVALPILAAAVPFLSFSTGTWGIWTGAIVWGAAMGLHESTMRAAIADMVPAERRGRAYGVFGAAYGLTWMIGGAAIGALYGVSVGSVQVFVVVVEALALATFLPLLRSGPTLAPSP